jgi:hypothetical protein
MPVQVWPHTGQPLAISTSQVQRALRDNIDIAAEIRRHAPHIGWPPIITGAPWPERTGDINRWPDIAIVDGNPNGIDSILDRLGITIANLRDTARFVYDNLGWKPEEAIMVAERHRFGARGAGTVERGGCSMTIKRRCDHCWHDGCAGKSLRRGGFGKRWFCCHCGERRCRPRNDQRPHGRFWGGR